MANPPNPFQSARLTFRALEEDDQDFMQKLHGDAVGFTNSEIMLKRPQSKNDTKKTFEYLSECLLCCVISITEVQGDKDNEAGSPIGIVNLTSLPANEVHHRNTELGLSLLPTQQGKGYGTEVINWALEWAFESANMHRVAAKAFEYNPGARRLYERLGFKHEGTIREMFWHKGRWWDDYEYGMLASEWRAHQKAG